MNESQKEQKKGQDIAQKALDLEISRIRKEPKNSSLAKLNPYIYSGAELTTHLFPALGTLKMKGVLWYKVKSTLVIIGGRKNGVARFKGSGFGLDIGTFTSQLFGTFIVDPGTIKEDCFFTLLAADFAEGVVSFTIYRSKKGELCGVFAGTTEGIEAGAVAGKGTLKILGF